MNFGLSNQQLVAHGKAENGSENVKTKNFIIMIKPIPQKYLLKLAGTFLMPLLLTGVSWAQNSSVAKNAIKKKAALTQPLVNIKIKADTGYSLPDATTNTGDLHDEYNLIKLKLIIAGIPPQDDVPVKLILQNNYTSTGPQFFSASGTSGSFTTKVSKALFNVNGSAKTISVQVPIQFSNVPNMKGIAYITIEKQPEYAEINFGKPLIQPQPLTRNARHNLITLLDNSTVENLDTLKPNTVNQFPIKLNFRLAKGTGKDTSVDVNAKTLVDMNSIKLSDNGQNRIYTVKIDSEEWNNNKDTTVTKGINLFVQQTMMVTDTQYVALYLKGDKNRHIVKLVPYKAKAKTAAVNLVTSGKAGIVSSGKKGITRDYTASTNSFIDSINVKVKLRGKYDDKHNQLVFAFLDSALSKHFQIMENPITITRNEWYNGTNADKSKKDSLPEFETTISIPLHIKTINISDSLNNIQNLDLILKGQTQVYRGSQQIKVSIKDKPFWAEAGTNFDLLDNIKTNNFYAGVYMFDKDVARIGQIRWLNKLFNKNNSTSDKSNNLSFTGGVYESQSISTGSRADSTFNYKNGASTIYNQNGTIHGYQYYTDTGSIKSTTQVKSIGIFFSPHLRLTNGKTDENGLHLFFSLYAELLWQRVSTTLDYSKTNLTATIPLDSTKTIPSGIPYKQQSFNLDYRSHYYGLGLPVYIKANGYNLYINTVFGVTNQRFVITDNSTAMLNANQYSPTVQNLNPTYTQILNFAQPKSRWNNFYLVQYRLNEVVYGLTFSGEIRGLLLYGSKPVITLALSKKFDLSALLKPIVAPF
ncbi:MAG TPA: hypothetical protein VGC01_08565 [Mucilaginibacter sp.]